MTFAQFVAIYTSKTINNSALSSLFLDALRQACRDSLRAVFTVPTVLQAPVTFGGYSADKFSLSPEVWSATDGRGRLLTGGSDSALPAALSEDIQFENANGVAYKVGAAFTEIPSSVELAKDGLCHYGSFMEIVGKSAAPSAVSDSGTGLVFTVTSITESGVSNAGRWCMVYKNSPVSGVMSEAVKTAQVSWSGGVNRITISGYLGQSGSVSLTAADYTVVLLGVQVLRNASFPAFGPSVANPVVYFGTVTGVGAGGTPSVSDTTGQPQAVDFGTFVQQCAEVDAHGRWKVAVKADASDSATPQLSVFSSAGTRTFWVDEAGRLHFNGELSSSGLPLGEASPNNAIASRLPQTSILAAINRSANHEQLLEALCEGTRINALVSEVSGLDVAVAIGRGVSAGQLVTIPATASHTLIDNASALIVWRHSSQSVLFTASPAAGDILLARAETSGGAIVSLINTPQWLGNVAQRLEISVGGQDSHFSTLADAVDFAALSEFLWSRGCDIVVKGNTVETRVAKLQSNNITIRGTGPGGAFADFCIKWSGERACIDLNGCKGCTIRDLELVYDYPSALTDPVPTRIAIVDDAGYCDNVLIENVLVRSLQIRRLHGYVRDHADGAGRVRVLRFQGEGATEFGIDLSHTSNALLQDVRLASGLGPSGPNPWASQNEAGSGTLFGIKVAASEMATLNQVWVQDWANRSIVLAGAQAMLSDVVVGDGHLNGTGGGGLYVGIENSCTTRSWLSRCRVAASDGSTGLTDDAFGVLIDGPRCMAHMIDATAEIGDNSQAGIKLSDNAQFCIVTCCQTNGLGIDNTGVNAADNTLDNNRDD